MRVVLDTNVLVSGVIRPQGKPGEVLQRLRNNEFTLLTSAAALTELQDVLTRPRIQNKYGVTDADVETVLAFLLLRGELLTPQHSVTACRDPKDNKFLEIALTGEADVVVSGDQDLLVLHPFEEIPILSPADFLSMLA